MREQDLSGAVTAWMALAGCTEVWAEIPAPGSGSAIDLVGLRGEDLLCAELKTGWTKHLRRQTVRHQIITPRVYACAPTSPRECTVQAYRSAGVGMLRVEGESCSCIVEPKQRIEPCEWYTKRVRWYLSRMQSGGIGGLQNVAGEGPAREVAARLAEYRKGHPNATWKEMYAAVPNHYWSYRSMYGAMRMLEERDNRRARAAQTGRTQEGRKL